MDGNTGDEDGAHHPLPESKRHEGSHTGQRDEGDPDAVQGSEHTPSIRPGRDIVNRRFLALSAVLLAACTSLPVGQTAPSSSSVTTTTTVVTTTTSTIADTTTTVLSSTPLGLITPTGIPVAVRLVSPDGYIVWSPCGNLTRVTDGEPIYGARVVLDPGHGGNRDIGSQGRNGLPEKVANLRVAFEAQAQLEARGIPTVLTRTADYATTIPVRARLADHLGAEVLVSIHHNGPTPGPSPTPGTEIFYQSFSAESRRLGGVLYEHVVDALSQFSDVQWAKAPDGGVITVLNEDGRDTYGMVRRPRTPAVLLEMGYMSNPSEAELFATVEYVEVAGRAIADAIEAYLNTDVPGTGWYEPGRTFRAAPGLSGAACVETPLE